MPSLWGLHLLLLVLFDTFILAFNNVSLSRCVCVCVCLDAFKDRLYVLLVCVHECVGVCLLGEGGREVVIMLK